MVSTCCKYPSKRRCLKDVATDRGVIIRVNELPCGEKGDVMPNLSKAWILRKEYHFGAVVQSQKTSA